MRSIPKVLLVEDSEERFEKIQSWTPKDVRLIWVTCAGSALGVLAHGEREDYAGIMLDFNLYQKMMTADRMPGTGADVARKIIQRISNDTPILVHSMNPEERNRLVSMLQENGFPVLQIPMSALTQEELSKWLEECREVHADRIAS